MACGGDGPIDAAPATAPPPAINGQSRRGRRRLLGLPASISEERAGSETWNAADEGDPLTQWRCGPAIRPIGWRRARALLLGIGTVNLPQLLGQPTARTTMRLFPPPLHVCLRRVTGFKSRGGRSCVRRRLTTGRACGRAVQRPGCHDGGARQDLRSLTHAITYLNRQTGPASAARRCCVQSGGAALHARARSAAVTSEAHPPLHASGCSCRCGAMFMWVGRKRSPWCIRCLRRPPDSLSSLFHKPGRDQIAA